MGGKGGVAKVGVAKGGAISKLALVSESCTSCSNFKSNCIVSGMNYRQTIRIKLVYWEGGGQLSHVRTGEKSALSKLISSIATKREKENCNFNSFIVCRVPCYQTLTQRLSSRKTYL